MHPEGCCLEVCKKGRHKNRGGVGESREGRKNRVWKSGPRQQRPDRNKLCLLNSPGPADQCDELPYLTAEKIERVDLAGRGPFQEINLNVMAEGRRNNASMSRGFRNLPTGLILTSRS